MTDAAVAPDGRTGRAPQSRPEAGRGGGRRSRLAVAALLLVLAATAGRVAAALQPGLWADEIFSLAMATGHSLEHPPAAADPSLGDFVQPREARPPGYYRRYTEHDERPAGIGRVARAVLLSDTNPPFYYLLLNPWTRALGTGDAALRLFSVWWAALSLPLLWLLGRELGGRRAAWSACLLFSFAPIAIYYSAEGRMYSLLWLLALGLAWLTLRISTAGVGPGLALSWVLVGAAGLLSHYFFAFVWLACAGWLWVAGTPARRSRVAALAAVTLLIALPWYLEVPASLARWRVSGGWLEGELGWPRALGRPFALAGGLFSGRSYLGGWRRADQALALLSLLLAGWLAVGGLLRSLFSRRLLLAWAWLAAACAGPVVFDLLRNSTTSEIQRYALPGLPAAVLLAAVGMSRLPPFAHVGLLAAVLLAWLPGARKAFAPNVARPSQPYRVLDARLEAWAGPGDLVLVSSIPSGVVGVARYLSRDIPLASRVPQLASGEAPSDLESLLAGHRRVALVKIHDLGAPAPAEAWLRAHARPLGREDFRNSRAEVLYFEPAGGGVFHPAAE